MPSNLVMGVHLDFNLASERHPMRVFANKVGDMLARAQPFAKSLAPTRLRLVYDNGPTFQEDLLARIVDGKIRARVKPLIGKALYVEDVDGYPVRSYLLLPKGEIVRL